MGDQQVNRVENRKDMNHFVYCLLQDVHALKYMLENDWFETDPIRIGAEQEMCMISPSYKPSYDNMKALELIDNPSFTTELARFNLEVNLQPREFHGSALSDMHNELKGCLEGAMEKIKPLDALLIFAGILPTIRRSDIVLDNLTPVPRYYALMEALKEMRGDHFELRLTGIDELNIKQENAMLEACNTSFQVHLQVKPEEFVPKYNIAQALSGPVMAVAVNSPMLFGRRLWRETRIALFQQSLDIRTSQEHLRERSPRVTFGHNWLKRSILEIYQEDIARFQVLLSADVKDDAFAKIHEGVTPKLKALNTHNSTVYRWNRPCYGVSPNGKPHLRIENRLFPSGPSLPDEMANAAFWLGLMNGMEDEVGDVRKIMDFDDAKNNFIAAARLGLDTKFRWFKGQRISAIELISKQLLPIARHGLEKAKIDKSDIDKYMGVIEERVDKGCTGSQWMLDSFARLSSQGTPRDEISSVITASIVRQQGEGKPVAQWDLADPDDVDYEPMDLLVEESMNTDLITVREDDLMDLAVNLMDWRRIRHILVEDGKGQLCGLVTSRTAMRYYGSQVMGDDGREVKRVGDVMIKNPVCVSPKDTLLRALDVMRTNGVSCLPVIDKGQLIGILTEADFLTITGNLLHRLDRKRKARKKSSAS